MKDDAPTDLRQRTRAFAVRIMRVGDSLPRTRSGNVAGYQIVRSGSSVGAHYREGVRSRSDAEIILCKKSESTKTTLRFILHPSAFILAPAMIDA